MSDFAVIPVSADTRAPAGAPRVADADTAATMLERDRQFRSVFFDAADAMLILDDDRRIVEANPAACELFGLPSEAVVEHPLDGLILDQESLSSTWHEVLALGGAQREHRVRARSGGVRVVECSYRAHVHGRRHLCVARDITDRRVMEERLMQAEKIESVGRLAGGIAHDFNNLLTAILGYTELLLGSRRADDPERRDLEEIQKAGQRAAALTQQLLAFSRKQVLMPKQVDLNQIVAGLKTMLGRLLREDIALVCQPAPTNWRKLTTSVVSSTGARCSSSGPVWTVRRNTTRWLRSIAKVML